MDNYEVTINFTFNYVIWIAAVYIMTNFILVIFENLVHGSERQKIFKNPYVDTLFKLLFGTAWIIIRIFYILFLRLPIELICQKLFSFKSIYLGYLIKYHFCYWFGFQVGNYVIDNKKYANNAVKLYNKGSKEDPFLKYRIRLMMRRAGFTFNEKKEIIYNPYEQ